jgi:hypothetical protein
LIFKKRCPLGQGRLKVSGAGCAECLVSELSAGSVYRTGTEQCAIGQSAQERAVPATMLRSHAWRAPTEFHPQERAMPATMLRSRAWRAPTEYHSQERAMPATMLLSRAWRAPTEFHP